MKTIQTLALALFTLAGSSAMADDATVVQDHFVPTRTRAEVRAEVLQARAAGMIRFVDEVQGQLPAPDAPMHSTLTRQQVRAAMFQARAAHDPLANPPA